MASVRDGEMMTRFSAQVDDEICTVMYIHHLDSYMTTSFLLAAYADTSHKTIAIDVARAGL